LPFDLFAKKIIEWQIAQHTYTELKKLKKKKFEFEKISSLELLDFKGR